MSRGPGPGGGGPPNGGLGDRRNREERRPLIEPMLTADGGSVPTDPDYTTYYTLPFLRYINLFRTLLLVDGIVAFALYLWDMDNEKILDGIIHFNIVHSTFDIAVISLLKMLLCLVLISLLEIFTVHILDQPYERSVVTHKSAVHASCITLTVLTFIYVIIKVAVVLNEVVSDDKYLAMPLTQNIMMGFVAVFCMLEMVMALYSYRAMRNISRIRTLHRINDQGQEVDENGRVIKKKADIKRLLILVIPEWPLISVGLVGLLVSNASQIAAPYYFDELDKTVITLFLIYTIGAIFSWLRTWFFLLAGHRFVARLRRDLFKNITDQEIAFFDVNRTGELTNRLASDTQLLQDVVTDKLSMVIRYILQILGSLAFMFYLNASLTGILLAVVPIVSIGARKYGGFVRNLNAKFQDRLADSGATAEENISSMRTVRSFAGEYKAQQQYNIAINESYNIGKKLAFAQGTFAGGIGVVAYGTVTIVLWYGGKLVNEKVLSPGILTSFLLYTLQVAMAFAFVSGLYGSFMQAVGASVRVFELLDRRSNVRNSGGDIPDKMDGVIEFRDVVFVYPARPDNQVLKGISFTMRKGQMIALVGPSGGGKSTTVSLIERFYDPISGDILIDGAPLQDLDPSWVRRRISIVSQEPTLFACSIRENIAFGREATHDEVVLAAQQANAHNFIMTFEEGYDTLVGERGVRLSGGQKQRIAIARALIMDPAVLLLDEATSALDAENERLVQEAIDRAMENRTVLVIAHRLSTVRNADKVMVVDHGQIVETGTHDELISFDGVYKRLVLRQLMSGGSDLNNSMQSSAKEESGESTRSDQGGEHPTSPIDSGKADAKTQLLIDDNDDKSGESFGFNYPGMSNNALASPEKGEQAKFHKSNNEDNTVDMSFTNGDSDA